MMLNEQPPPPWHKQFWPWFLITVPIITIMVGFTLLWLAINTQDSLVKDDYYKEGKAININLNKTEYAKQLGVTTLLHITDEVVKLSFKGGAPKDKAALILEFFHPTLSTNDFTLLLTHTTGKNTKESVYIASLDKPITGKWQITLWPHHKEWRVQQSFKFPQLTPIVFDP